MAYSRIFTFAAGGAYAGLATVGYRLVAAGTVYTAATRVASGVTEMPPGSGSYVALASVPDGFVGHILWDTGGGSPAYSIPEEINPRGNTEYLDAAVSALPAGVWNLSTSGYLVGSYGGLLVAQLDFNVGSRLASSAYTAAPTAAQVWGYGGGRTITGNVTVGGYALGYDPETRLLTSPGNKIATDPSGRVDLRPFGAAFNGIQPNAAFFTNAPSGGGGGGGSLTPEEHAKLMSLGALPVTLVSPLTAGGALRLRRGMAYKAAYSNAPAWTVSADLAGATVELRDSNGPTIAAATKTLDGSVWTLTFDVDDEVTAALERGARPYVLVALHGADPVELLSGPLTVD